MDPEPSEFICIDCNLRFKNSGTYEKHKRKFCQGRKEHSSRPSWSPTNGTNANYTSSVYHYDRRDLSAARTASSREFWNGKAGTVLGTTNEDYRRTLSNEDTRSARYDSFKHITINSKYNSEIEELMTEQNRLEEHKRAIQDKLANMRTDGKRTIAFEAPTTTNYPERKMLNNNGGDIEEKINNLYQFLAKQKKNNQRNGTSRESNKQFFDGYRSHINQLKQEYIQEGGNNLKVLSMLQNLENDASRTDDSLNNDESDLIIQKLQNQLAMYQRTNQSLMQELQSVNRAREFRYDQAYTQQPIVSAERGFPRADLGNLHEQRLLEMKQEAEIYRYQLELERLKAELQTIRGGGLPHLQALPPLPQTQGQHKTIVSNMDMREQSLSKPSTIVSDEAFERAPYDPGSGFALFWDFVVGIPLPSEQCRIAVTMFKDGKPVSDTRLLPAVPCSQPRDTSMSIPGGMNNAECSAVLGVKQIFPRCLPSQSLTLAAQLQLGSQYDASFESMQDAGWSIIDVFDRLNRVISGRWKVPVRVPPFAPDLTPADVNTIQQLDRCELFYRLVNARNTLAQEAIVLKSEQTHLYQYPPLERKLTPAHTARLEPLGPIMQTRPESIERPRKKSVKPQRRNSTPSPSTTPTSPAVERQRKQPTPKPVTPIIAAPPQLPQREPTPSPPPPQPPVSEPSPLPVVTSKPSTPNARVTELIGFQFDKIYDYEEKIARLKVTLYGSDGKVLTLDNSTAIQRTEYCRSLFLKSLLSFTLYKVWFNDVIISPNSFAVIEAYAPSASLPLAEEAEELICWTALRLGLAVQQPERTESRNSSDPDFEKEQDKVKLNVGKHEIPMYAPPVLDTRLLRSSFKNNQDFHGCELLGKSYMDLFIFNRTTPPVPIPSSISIYKDEDNCPEGAWVQGQSRSPPSSIFKNGDGFELYIDEARFLPDNCGFVKVISSLYDSKFTKLKEEFENDINLDLDPRNPEFDLKFEFRDFCYPPTTTILIKVYIIDVLTRATQRLGVAILPVFVKQGTLDRADDSDKQFCLNEGCYQLKLYNEISNNNRLIRNSLDSPIPCASLLVRLLLAPCYSDGQPKQAIEFLEDQWQSEGLLIPKPSYNTGRYDTTDCTPTVVECRLFQSYLKRKRTTVRDILRIVMDGKKTKNDQGIVDLVKNLMKNLQTLSVPNADMSYLAKYNSMHGFMFSLDSAQNLPWNGFTFASFCLSPPASFYKGKLDDSVVYITKLDLDGLIRSPKWNDGVKIFPRRSFHSNLVGLVHLYEVRVVMKANELTYTLGAQAWTFVPVCNNEYPSHGYFQVGLFDGAPTVEIINSLENQPLFQTITNLRKRKIVKVVDRASVFVRIGDARRREELENVNKLTVRKNFLPRGTKFTTLVSSRQFATIIPANQNRDDYGNVLAGKFRMLVDQVFQQRS